MSAADYATDATGTRAHWYELRANLPDAIRTARGRLRYAGDTATLYRVPRGRSSSGPSEALAYYELAQWGPAALALYVRITRSDDPARWSAYTFLLGRHHDGRTYRRWTLADHWRADPFRAPSRIDP